LASNWPPKSGENSENRFFPQWQAQRTFFEGHGRNMQMGQGFAASSIVLKQRPSSAIFLQLPRHDNSSKSVGGNIVWVRVPPSAPAENSQETLVYQWFSGFLFAEKQKVYP
jgi:hypothetical protein